MAGINTPDSVGFEFTYFKLSWIIISVLGVVSNVLLLAVFIKDPLKCFRNSGTYLVMNLAVSDCLTCLFFPSLNVVKMTPYPPIFQFLTSFFASVSFLSVLSVSIDRFLIVAYPMKYRVLINGKTMVLWIAAILMVSSVIPLILFSDIRETSIYQAHFTFCTIVVIASSLMYSSTYYKLKKQSRDIAAVNSTKSRAQEKRILKEKRFLKTIVIIAFIAFVCAVPSLILNFIQHSEDMDNFTMKLATSSSSILLRTNFAVNPFVYILRLPSYREAFYLIYCKRRAAE